MTDFNASDRDVNRAIRSWLHEDRHEDVSRIAGAVLDQVEATPQRRARWWPARRTPTMNKFLRHGPRRRRRGGGRRGRGHRPLPRFTGFRPGRVTAATPSPSASAAEPSARGPSVAEPSASGLEEASPGGTVRLLARKTGRWATTIPFDPGLVRRRWSLFIWNHTGGDPPEGCRGARLYRKSDLWTCPTDPCPMGLNAAGHPRRPTLGCARGSPGLAQASR